MINSIIQFAAEEANAEEAAEGIAQLGIDPIQIVLQATTFLVLFFVLNKYGLNKIVANLKDRRDKIDESLKNAEQLEQLKNKIQADNEKIMAGARREADAVISKSHEEAGSIVSDAQARANKQADDIVTKAKAQAGNESDKAREELKSEMLSLVAEATETVLGEKIDDAKDKQLIEKALKQGASS